VTEITTTMPVALSEYNAHHYSTQELRNISCTTEHVSHTSNVSCSQSSCSLQLFSIDTFITVCHVKEAVFLMMLLAHTGSAPNNVKYCYNNEQTNNNNMSIGLPLLQSHFGDTYQISFQVLLLTAQ